MRDGQSSEVDANGARPPISVKEAAERLGVSPDTVRAHLRQGTLPGEKIKNTWAVYLDASQPADARDSGASADAQDYVLAESPATPAAEARFARPARQARQLVARASAVANHVRQRLRRR